MGRPSGSPKVMLAGPPVCRYPRLGDLGAVCSDTTAVSSPTSGPSRAATASVSKDLTQNSAMTISACAYDVVAGATPTVPALVPVGTPPPARGVSCQPPVTARTGWLDAVRLRRTAVMYSQTGRPR